MDPVNYDKNDKPFFLECNIFILFNKVKVFDMCSLFKVIDSYNYLIGKTSSHNTIHVQRIKW